MGARGAQNTFIIIRATEFIKIKIGNCIPQAICALFTKVCKIYFKNCDVTSFHTLRFKYPTKHLKMKVNTSEFIAIYITQYNPLLHMALRSANRNEVEPENELLLNSQVMWKKKSSHAIYVYNIKYFSHDSSNFA